MDKKQGLSINCLKNGGETLKNLKFVISEGEQL